MNSSQRTDRNERLGEVLRQGDPASGETGLAPAETQAMRRAVLSAVAAPEPRWSFRLAPAFAAGGVAVLSLVVALSLWRTHGSEPGQPVAPIVPAPSVPSPGLSPILSPDVVAVVSPPPPVHAVRRRERRPRIAKTPAVPSPAPEPAPMRQVQFSAPGGTRIIWLLPTR
ncbi:MAG TPA: hypothetical protein VGK45_10710 [Thermoanaerobaculia bacterium]